jgi:hypothetical protein
MSDSPRPQNYRDKPRRLREGAGTFSSRDRRAQVEEVPRQNDDLADSVEKEAMRRWGVSPVDRPG